MEFYKAWQKLREGRMPGVRVAHLKLTNVSKIRHKIIERLIALSGTNQSPVTLGDLPCAPILHMQTTASSENPLRIAFHWLNWELTPALCRFTSKIIGICPELQFHLFVFGDSLLTGSSKSQRVVTLAGMTGFVGVGFCGSGMVILKLR
jgi:hypothetical protein